MPENPQNYTSPAFSRFVWYFNWGDAEIINDEINISLIIEQPVEQTGHHKVEWIWGNQTTHAKVSAIDLLDVLTENWKELVSPYLYAPLQHDTSVDLTAKLNRSSDLAPLVFAVTGKSISIQSGLTLADPRSESLMVAESLSALGNSLAVELSKRGDNDRSLAWFEMRKLDFLPPMFQDVFGKTYSEDERDASSCYYANKLKMPVDRYNDAGLFEKAYHTLWWTKNHSGPEMQSLDGLRAHELGFLPSAPEIIRLAEMAFSVDLSKDSDKDFKAWCADGMSQNDLSIRAAMFYDKWPEIVLHPQIDTRGSEERIQAVFEASIAMLGLNNSMTKKC